MFRSPVPGESSSTGAASFCSSSSAIFDCQQPTGRWFSRHASRCAAAQNGLTTHHTATVAVRPLAANPPIARVCAVIDAYFISLPPGAFTLPFTLSTQWTTSSNLSAFTAFIYHTAFFVIYQSISINVRREIAERLYDGKSKKIVKRWYFATNQCLRWIANSEQRCYYLINSAFSGVKFMCKTGYKLIDKSTAATIIDFLVLLTRINYISHYWNISRIRISVSKIDWKCVKRRTARSLI